MEANTEEGIRDHVGLFPLDSAVEAESTRPFDKLILLVSRTSKVEGLTLAATRSGSLNCRIKVHR
jgi:hypothetical protein